MSRSCTSGQCCLCGWRCTTLNDSHATVAFYSELMHPPSTLVFERGPAPRHASNGLEFVYSGVIPRDNKIIPEPVPPTPAKPGSDRPAFLRRLTPCPGRRYPTTTRAACLYKLGAVRNTKESFSTLEKNQPGGLSWSGIVWRMDIAVLLVLP